MENNVISAGSSNGGDNKGGWLAVVIFSAAVAILSGGVSGWYFSRSKEREIVVLDIGKIIESQRKEFVEKYQNRGGGSEVRTEMERDISSFVEKLNKVVEEESRGKLVFVKDSVISEVRDITEDIEKRIKLKEVEK